MPDEEASSSEEPATPLPHLFRTLVPTSPWVDRLAFEVGRPASLACLSGEEVVAAIESLLRLGYEPSR